MKPKIKTYLLGTIPFIAVVILWQIFSTFNIFPGWLIASPLKVLVRFIELIQDGNLPRLMAASLLNIFPAFILSVLGAFICGVPIGLSKILHKMFIPFISALYSIPSLVWLPLIILILGFERQSIWTIVFISAFFRMIHNVIGGVRAVDYHWILAAKNIGLSKHATIIKVILPAITPNLIIGMRVGFGSAWRSLIGAEMIVMTLGGLGRYIWMAQWNFDFEKVIVGILIISAVGLIVDRIIFRTLEIYTLKKWGMMAEEKLETGFFN